MVYGVWCMMRGVCRLLCGVVWCLVSLYRLCAKRFIHGMNAVWTTVRVMLKDKSLKKSTKLTIQLLKSY